MITSQQLLDMETMFRGEVYLTGSLDSNLYTSQFLKMAVHPTVCLVSKPRTQNLVMDIVTSLLNFLVTINHLTKQDLVDGLPKFKYNKDHLCSACKQGKRKKTILTPKLVPSTHFNLELIHMDLCGPMRIESINGKRYILVIVAVTSVHWAVFFFSKQKRWL
ncbi:hypothetical protein Tco_0098039 [Tanacetum coccineum]